MSNIERFNLRIDRLACGEAYSMQPQDGGPWIKYEDHTASVSSLQAEVVKLRKALETFAKEELNNEHCSEDNELVAPKYLDLTYGDFRRVRALKEGETTVEAIEPGEAEAGQGAAKSPA